MNGVKIKDIRGALIDTRKSITINSARPLGKTTQMLNGIYNQFVNEQGEVALTLNRDALAQMMANDDTLWNQGEDLEPFRDYWRSRADAIISKQHELFERVSNP